MPRAHALSYVIPARNAGVTLPQTLQSLLAQTTPQWRAVVIDDGSTDNTAVIAQAFNDDRITTIRTPPQGVASAREAGVDELPDDGSPVCFLDADDWVEPEHAALLLEAIAGHDAVACGYAMVDKDGTDLDFRRSPASTDGLLEQQIECNRFLIGCVAISRSVIERVRSQYGSLFDASLRCEDWDFWLRVTKTGARWATPIDRPLLNYRQCASSRSSALGEMYRDSLAVIQLHAPNSDSAVLAQRQTGLRILSQAIACSESELAQAILSDLGSLQQEDFDQLASTLRWAFVVLDLSRFNAGGVSLVDITHRIERSLGSAVDAKALALRATWTDNDWKCIAQRALNTLNSDQLLVVYGLGHNGRLALRELQAIAPERIAWMDDGAPLEQLGLPRLCLGDLDDRHVVFVTPDSRAALMSRLESARPSRVLLPEQLHDAPALVSADD